MCHRRRATVQPVRATVHRHPNIPLHRQHTRQHRHPLHLAVHNTVQRARTTAQPVRCIHQAHLAHRTVHRACRRLHHRTHRPAHRLTHHRNIRPRARRTHQRRPNIAQPIQRTHHRDKHTVQLVRLTHHPVLNKLHDDQNVMLMSVHVIWNVVLFVLPALLQVT